MNSTSIEKFLCGKIKNGDFPSASYLVGENGSIQSADAFGNAVLTPQEISAGTDTIYDLASLTKPLVTGLIAAILYESGELSLDSPLSLYFGETIGDKGTITIRGLLTHTSGLPAWKPFYLFAEHGIGAGANVFSQIVDALYEYEPGSKVLYSDYNFLLLGMIIEKVAGLPLDLAAERFLVEPLALTNTFFNPPEQKRLKIAASETGNGYEKSMCFEMFPDHHLEPGLFREDVIWGEVHDGNCFYMGGVAGHAGLFSNTEEVYKIAMQFLGESTELLKPATCRLFRKNFTPGLNQHRSFGFQLASTNGCSAGSRLPGDSFGHLGFTGTSIWIDGQNSRVFILLTNRTHAKALPFADLGETRQLFNSISVEESRRKKHK